MKIKVIVPIFILVFVLINGPVLASGTELMTMYSVRITIVDDEIEYEWEYDSPSHYEYEEGNTVMKGEAAKEKVEEMTNLLKLDEKEDVLNYVKRVKENGYPNLKRLDIRYKNNESKLCTWVWKAESK